MNTRWAWAIVAAAAAYQAVLFLRFGRRALALVAAELTVAAVFFAGVEVIARVAAWRHPVHEVLHLAPDRDVGWRSVPGLHFVWTGQGGEFEEPVAMNARGFRDRERTEQPGPDVARIALLGDSLIEALQVPFESTAGQVLERKLNEPSERGVAASHWEVLNFGVSNFSLGQDLLMWEAHARRYRPRYVFVPVARFMMFRSIDPYGAAVLPAARRRSLRLRPTFDLGEDGLLREPAPDYDAFVHLQEKVIREDFGGRRSRPRQPASYAVDWLARRLSPPPAEGLVTPARWDLRGVVLLNLQILSELSWEVERSEGTLVVLDMVRYFYPEDKGVSALLRSFCGERGIGYVSVSDDFENAERGGVVVRWPRDGHLTAEGNRVLAEAIWRWGRAGQGAASSS